MPTGPSTPVVPTTPPSGERPATTEEIISAYAKKHKVPPALALAVARQESNFNNAAVSGKGARGIFQLMPDTAKELGVNPDDPVQNIDGGLRYLRQLSDKYGGDVHKTLMAYNGGMGNVDRGTISPDAQVYATDVMRRISEGVRAGQSAGAVTTAPGTASTPPPARVPLPPALEANRTAALARTDLPPDIRAEFERMSGASGQPDAMLANVTQMGGMVDPRTQTGRENLAGIGGSVAMGIATEGLSTAAGVLPWLARIVGPVLGAATAGAAEGAGEQVAGTAAPGTSPTQSGVRQGAYEFGGQAFMWPLKRLGKAILGSQVRRAAESALEQGVTSARSALGATSTRVADGVTAAREMARQAVAATKTAATERVADVTRRAGQQTTSAKKLAGELVAQTELDNAAALADVQTHYDNLLAAPPDALAPGQLTKEAVEGPAKKALDMAGQRVSEAAQSGPPIAMTPIQGALDAMVSKARPASIFGEPAPAQAIGFGHVAARPVGAVAGERISVDEYRKLAAQSLGLLETHPLPGLLGQIQHAPESISFADAHKLKMLLDESVNWDRTAKKHLEKITKGLRTTLRGALAVHEPYNVATGAYHAMVPLYRKGVGRRVITAASTPGGADAIAKTLNVKNPAQALALRDLLLTQSAAGGDPELGQQAWDAVRSSFVYDKVLRGGVKDLSTRVQQLVEQHPEFARAVLNDESSQRIISNLDRVGQAYQRAVEQSATDLASTKQLGSEVVQAAKDSGASDIAHAERTKVAAIEKAKQAKATAIQEARQRGEGIRQAARAAVTRGTEDLKALKKSSLVQNTLTGQGANLLRAIKLGPGSIWGSLSLIRLLEGPESKDLLQWMSHSDANTQRAVRILTGQVPDRVAAATIREMVHALTPPIKEKTPSGAGTVPAAP